MVRSLIGNGRHPRIDEIEEGFSEKMGVAHAIWLPSVRAGILWALRVFAGPETRVIGPAFTCEHVHTAIASSGLAWQLVDAAPNGFLMDRESLESVQQGTTCAVFCEVFGHAYDFFGKFSGGADSQHAFRILDMAVAVPTRALLGRLADHDLALLSFGAGKGMTAGWGGIAFTRDAVLAAELKSVRDSSLERATGRLVFTRSTKILLQTALYGRIVYGMARRLHDVRSERQASGVRGQFDDGPLGGHWRLASTYLDRSLIHYNLMRAEEYENKRVADARRYRDNLAGVAGMTLPPCSDNALSHFTVRVSADRRAEVRSCLWKAGIDVGTYFAFPSFLAIDQYPNASRLASEVLNLPLGRGLGVSDIDRISEMLIRCTGNERQEAPADHSNDLIRQAPPATVSQR